MNLFLIRHFESTKNINNSLSSKEDSEPLTANAKLDCIQFSKQFKRFLESNNLSLKKINCSASVRAEETANILATELDNIQIESFHEFKSTFAGNYAGISLNEIGSTDFFSKNYYLYRKGVYNSYNFDILWNNDSRETKIDFETRVIDCLVKIIDCSDSTMVIIAHRSPIIAILLYIARMEYRYSADFYGYVHLDLGNVTWVHRDENGKWDILFVNESITSLMHNG